MSDPQGKTDPLEQWRELRDTYMDIWAKASGEAVNSDAYAQATGAMLEAFLTTSSPYRDAQKKAMISALEQCNMPSRDDYVRLAERMGNMELLLDDIDAKLRQIYQVVVKVSAQTAHVAQFTARPAAVESLKAAEEPPAAAKFAASEPPEEAPEKPEPAKPKLAAAPQRPTVVEQAAAPRPKNGHAAKSKPRSTKNPKKGV